VRSEDAGAGHRPQPRRFAQHDFKADIEGAPVGEFICKSVIRTCESFSPPDDQFLCRFDCCGDSCLTCARRGHQYNFRVRSTYSWVDCIDGRMLSRYVDLVSHSKRHDYKFNRHLCCFLFVWITRVFLQPKQEKHGPRFEFNGLKVEHTDGYSVPVIQVSNTNETPATSYLLIGAIFISDSENNTINKDINEIVNQAEEQAKKAVLTPADQLQITRGMGISLKLRPIPNADIALVDNGSKKMYVVMLAVYANTQTPTNRMWVTELRARITKPFNDFESCPSHNRYFYSDRFLNKID